MKTRKRLFVLIIISAFVFFMSTSVGLGRSDFADNFSCNGDLIKGWYWLRDAPFQHYAQWIFETIPTGDRDIILDITGLATDRPNGRRGLPAECMLIYEAPGGKVLVRQEISLPNISQSDDPDGYTCHGQIIIPRQVLQDASVLFVRIERIGQETNQIAFRKKSISIMQSEEILPLTSQTLSPGQGRQLPDTDDQNESFLIQPGMYYGDLGGQTSGGQRDKEDWYSLNMQEGQIIGLQLTQPSNGSFAIYLRKPESNSSVGHRVTRGDIRTLQYVADVAGVWFIKVSRSSGEGEYQLTVDVQNQNDAGSSQDAGDTLEEAMMLSPGEYDGFLKSADNNDWYKINLSEGQTVDFRLKMPSGAKYGLFLYRPDSNYSEGIVHNKDNITTLQHNIEITGNWYIRIQRSTGEGDYQLSVDISGYPSAQSNQSEQSQSVDSQQLNAAVFNSNGQQIEGWYWLRDPVLNHYAEWTFKDVPAGDDELILDLTALATDQASGGKGHSATFRLIYGFPGSKDMGGVFKAEEITLPNISSNNDPVGYTCRALVSIPRAFMSGASTFFFRVERIYSGDNHIAFNQDSIVLWTENPILNSTSIKKINIK